MAPGKNDENFQFNPLHELDRSLSHIVVRLEKRGLRKTVTVVQGLPESSSREVAKSLKHKFEVGGTAKEGLVLLQGDHRWRIKDELVRLGFATESIEVI